MAIKVWDGSSWKDVGGGTLETLNPMTAPTANAIHTSGNMGSFAHWFTLNGSFLIDFLSFEASASGMNVQVQVIIDGVSTVFTEIGRNSNYPFKPTYISYFGATNPIPITSGTFFPSSGAGRKPNHYQFHNVTDYTHVNSIHTGTKQMLVSSKGNSFVLKNPIKVNSSIVVNYKVIATAGNQYVYYDIGGRQA